MENGKARVTGTASRHRNSPVILGRPTPLGNAANPTQSGQMADFAASPRPI